MDKFNLQINSSGAWRNVLVGMTKEQMQQIEEHVTALAAIVGSSHKWRVVRPETEWSPLTVVAYCQAPDCRWLGPKRKHHG